MVVAGKDKGRLGFVKEKDEREMRVILVRVLVCCVFPGKDHGTIFVLTLLKIIIIIIMKATN